MDNLAAHQLGVPDELVAQANANAVVTVLAPACSTKPAKSARSQLWVVSLKPNARRMAR